MGFPKNIDGLFNVGAAMSRRALNPAVAVALLSTQVGCGRLHDADEVPALICAENLLAEDSDRGSRRAELANGGNANTTEISGDLCQTRDYIAVDPSSLVPLSNERLNDLLKWRLAGFAYESTEGILGAYENKGFVGATLSDDCSAGNFCATICPEWEGESTFVLTDTCKYVVGIDGDSADIFPALSEAESE